MKIKSLLINLSFFTIWIFCMILVYNQNYADAGANNLNQVKTVSSLQADTYRWYDVTINDKKIGYAMMSYSKTNLGYVFKDYSLLRLPMAGVVREVLLDFFAVVDDEFAVRSFTFGLTSGEYSTDVFGTVVNGNLELKVQTGSYKTNLAFPAGEGLYFPAVAPLLLASKGFPQGEFRLPGIDPISLTITDIIISAGERENIDVNGQTYEVRKLVISADGVESTMWVTDDGAVVKEEEAAGMGMTITSKEKALDIPETDLQWDILKALAVSSNREIDNPRDVVYMKVELTGIEPAGFNLNDDFQKIVSIAPLIIEVTPNKQFKGDRSDNNDEQIKKYLQPESFVQSDNPKIIKQSKIITSDIENDSLKALSLVDWVYNNIEKDLAISLPSAVDVLRVRRGDCNEHSVLFTALARAAGIPTKTCIGIVYSEGMFYYHAWPAVYVNNHWQPVDPTFGQNTADATHIKLLEGGFDSQASLMRVVGKLKVNILHVVSAGDVSTITDVAFKDDKTK